MLTITSEQALAAAPDLSAAQAGRKLADPRHWRNLGYSAQALWGECQGSALYQVRVELASLNVKCSCPSRKFPCKHGIGLMLMAATAPDALTESAPPDWVASWLEKRAARAEAAATPKAPAASLEVAKDLAKLIDAQPGMHAVLTRKGDYFVPLEKRFQIAREHKADLFVSIHANSCPDYCDARGASVWVLSTHGKQSEAGKWLAKSENASDLIGGVSLDDKSHMLASVLLDLSQGASMHAAHEVGSDVLSALGKIGPLYRDTVQGANFVVLRSPDVPSILVETAFISNRSDERRLDSSKDRKRLAEAVLTGVKQYFENTPPPGTWLAEQRNERLHLTANAAIQVAANGKTAAGAKAVIPDAPTMVASVKNLARADTDVQDMHKVSRGETLSGIAQHYGVSMTALRSANSSKIQTGGGIQVGQVLLIPSS